MSASNLYSDIKIYPSKVDTGNFKGSGSVVVLGTMEVKFRIMNGKNGMFVSWPSREYEKEGKKAYSNEVRFVDEATKKAIDDGIMAAFNSGVVSTPSTNGGKATSRTSRVPF